VVVLFLFRNKRIGTVDLTDGIDFFIGLYANLGSILVVNEQNETYISDIQHVRRETMQ
jgi:hypothetical protein